MQGMPWALVTNRVRFSDRTSLSPLGFYFARNVFPKEKAEQIYKESPGWGVLD